MSNETQPISNKTDINNTSTQEASKKVSKAKVGKDEINNTDVNIVNKQAVVLENAKTTAVVTATVSVDTASLQSKKQDGVGVNGEATNSKQHDNAPQSDNQTQNQQNIEIQLAPIAAVSASNIQMPHQSIHTYYTPGYISNTSAQLSNAGEQLGSISYAPSVQIAEMDPNASGQWSPNDQMQYINQYQYNPYINRGYTSNIPAYNYANYNIIPGEYYPSAALLAFPANTNQTSMYDTTNTSTKIYQQKQKLNYNSNNYNDYYNKDKIRSSNFNPSANYAYNFIPGDHSYISQIQHVSDNIVNNPGYAYRKTNGNKTNSTSSSRTSNEKYAIKNPKYNADAGENDKSNTNNTSNNTSDDNVNSSNGDSSEKGGHNWSDIVSGKPKHAYNKDDNNNIPDSFPNKNRNKSDSVHVKSAENNTTTLNNNKTNDDNSNNSNDESGEKGHKWSDVVLGKSKQPYSKEDSNNREESLENNTNKNHNEPNSGNTNNSNDETFVKITNKSNKQHYYNNTTNHNHAEYYNNNNYNHYINQYQQPNHYIDESSYYYTQHYLDTNVNLLSSDMLNNPNFISTHPATSPSSINYLSNHYHGSNLNNHFKKKSNYNKQYKNSSISDKYNPTNFTYNGELEGVKLSKFFVIKSYSAEDIIHSIRHGIWCSTKTGNSRLDEAFSKSNKHKNMSVYLFFSVNGSGQFCGMAEMISKVDYNSSSQIWTQDKWIGQFEVKWIFVKDVSNGQLKTITLPNNEDKPVTNSRDTQEIPFEQAIKVLEVFKSSPVTTSILDESDYFPYLNENNRKPKVFNTDYRSYNNNITNYKQYIVERKQYDTNSKKILLKHDHINNNTETTTSTATTSPSPKPATSTTITTSTTAHKKV